MTLFPSQAGTEPVSLLSWSPCGSYLLAAHPSGSFRVWQTHSWWPLKWSAAEGKGSAAGGWWVRGRAPPAGGARRGGAGAVVQLGSPAGLLAFGFARWHMPGCGRRAPWLLAVVSCWQLCFPLTPGPSLLFSQPPALGAWRAGGIAGACWSPDSRTLLLAYAAAPQQLVTLHFTAEPPSLQAQLLPLSLPEIAGRGASRVGCGALAGAHKGEGGAGRLLSARTHPPSGAVRHGLQRQQPSCQDAAGAAAKSPHLLLPLCLTANGSSRAAAVIEGMAWDPRGQRLAVAVGGTHPAAGYVALYDTRCDPILSVGCCKAGRQEEGREGS